MDRKLPEKKNEVTSRKAATFIPKAQERGESEDAKIDVTTKNVRHKKKTGYGTGHCRGSVASNVKR